MKRFLDNWLPWIVIIGIFAFALSLIAKAQSAPPASQPAVSPSNPPAVPTLGQQIDSLIAAKNTQIATLQQSSGQAANPMVLPTGSDLAAIFNSPSIVRYGSPGASYVWNTTGQSQLSSGGFKGAGNAIVTHPIPGGSGTGIAIHDGAELANVNLSGSGLAINASGPMKAGAYLHDLTFDSSLDWAIQLDAFADNVTISHCNFAAMNSYGVYCCSDNLHLDSCIFAPSIKQHNIRFEISAAAASKGHRPANAVVSNCTFADNIGTRGDPECFAAREIDGLAGSNCDFYGWARFGQGTPDAAWHARHIVLVNCRWHKLRPTGALIQIEHDCDVILVNCAFPGSATDSAIAVGERSTCTLINPTIVCPTPAPGLPPMQLKPLVIAAPSAKVTGADTAKVVYQAGGMR